MNKLKDIRAGVQIVRDTNQKLVLRPNNLESIVVERGISDPRTARATADTLTDLVLSVTFKSVASVPVLASTERYERAKDECVKGLCFHLYGELAIELDQAIRIVALRFGREFVENEIPELQKLNEQLGKLAKGEDF